MIKVLINYKGTILGVKSLAYYDQVKNEILDDLNKKRVVRNESHYYKYFLLKGFFEANF